MVECSTRDLILLHLGSTKGRDYRNTVPGICEVIGVDESKPGHGFEMLSSLQELKEEGLVEEEVKYIGELGEERNIYILTPEGVNKFNELEERFQNQEIKVKNGSDTKVKLKEVDKYLDSDNEPLVKAVAEVSTDGVLYLEKEFDDFVGRENELEKLERILGDVKEGKKRTVFVSSPSGIGKTALVEKAIGNEGFEVLRSKAQQDANRPYQSVIDALVDMDADIIDVLDEHTEPETEDEDVYEAQRTAMFNEFTDRIRNYSSRNPLAIFLDDLQWSDRATLDLFRHMVDNIDESPVMFVGAYRVEEVDEDDKLHEIFDLADVEIDLGPLKREETEKIVRRVLNEKEVDPSFVEIIHQKTGANPLFVEETMKKLLEENRVDPSYGIYPETPDEVSVSDTVESAINTRLRVLDYKTREILDKGSVIGDRIPLTILSNLSEIDEFELMDHIDILRDTNIWTGEDQVYRFSHDVLRESIYGEIDDGRKTELHAKVAEKIRKIYGEDLEEWYSEVANHYEKADELEKAMEFYEKAGEKSEDVYSFDDAVRNYKKALEIARNLEGKDSSLEIVQSIAWLYRIAGEYDKAQTYYEYVWKNAEDDETRMRTAGKIADIMITKSEFEEAYKMADEGHELWDGETPSKGVCLILRAKAGSKRRRGELDEALDIYDQTRDMAEEIGDKQNTGVVLNDMGIIYLQRDEGDKAKEVINEAIRLFREIDNKKSLSSQFNNLGLVYWKEGNLEKAIEEFEKALEIRRKIGNKGRLSSTLLNIGILSFYLGDWEKAQKYGKEAVEKSEATGKLGSLANANLNLGELYLDKGELDKSLEYFEKGLEIVNESGEKRVKSYIHTGLSRYYHVTKDLDESVSQAKKAIELSKEIGIMTPRLFGLDNLGRTELERGNLDEAREYLEDAVEISDEGEERNKADTRCSLAKVYLELGKVAEAYEMAKEAVEISESMADIERKIKSEMTMGMVLREQGEYDEAEKELRSSLERARNPGSKYQECLTLHELGVLENKRGTEEKASEYFEKVKEISEESGYELFMEKPRIE